MSAEYVDELEKIGFIESLEFSSLHDAGYFYVHRSCAAWSFGVTNDSNGCLGNVGAVVTTSLSRKCTFCNRFGASVSCKMSCVKFFHFSCVAASGGFQILQNFAAFCKEHLGQVPLVCSEEDVNCRSCSGLGDVSNLMMCSTCGDHYHGMCIGVAQIPNVRSGWKCNACRMCQICRVPDVTEGRSVACEQCDKVYHAQCLRPVMTSIPKYGWKCRCCRVCSDCGSRTPGAGASSRWHAHYTVCDSCYQQRNKGFSCPICHRAYRAAAHREMVKCSTCNKFVHNTCDNDAELTTYHIRKESNPEYEYICPPCKSGRIAVMRRNTSMDEDSMSASQESLNVEEFETDSAEKITAAAAASDFGLGKGKPFVASKVAKKRLGLGTGGGQTTGRQPSGGAGKLGFQKKLKFAEFGRKRGPKAKMRGIFGVPGVGLQKPCSDSTNKVEDEIGVENRLVLCSAKDKFVLTQDCCVMCGAIGTDQEGCLIACVQCGQCYHPYCVSVKVTKVILQKGWRCLDCTVCEGCGQRNDESRLILCDDCDISYHIYCMDPPLDFVPHGNWKCKWCAICQKCGTNDAGFNCSWMNSFTECGPCSSQSNCPSCAEGYTDGELIIQCTQCDRWLHCGCDAIRNEEEAEQCSEEGYTCILCRPKDVPPPHLIPKKKLLAITGIPYHDVVKQQFNDQMMLQSKSPADELEFGMILGLDGNHYLDGVCLSEHGLRQIKSLQIDLGRKKRKNKLIIEPTSADKEASILAAIESVVAGSSLDNSLEDMKVEPMDPRDEAEMYKDGMIWDRSDSSPPEGFTLCTTDQGVIVLRKRRQRNLQKLGIGGFSVRNRQVKSGGGGGKEVMGSKEDLDDDSGVSQNHMNTSTENILNSADKKKKHIRRKTKSKLIETYPNYLQEAFFGKSLLLDTTKSKFNQSQSSSEDESKITQVTDDKTIKLSMDELKMIEAMRVKQQQDEPRKNLAVNIPQYQQQQQQQPSPSPQLQQQLLLQQQHLQQQQQQQMIRQQQQLDIKPSIGTLTAINNRIMEENSNNSDSDALKDILPGDLMDSDLVKTIMNENDDLSKQSGINSNDADLRVKDEINDILSPHFNFDSMVMDSKDVEDLFKVVLTDESQESQESVMANQTQQQQQLQQQHQTNIQDSVVTTSIRSNVGQIQGLNVVDSFQQQQQQHQIPLHQQPQSLQQLNMHQQTMQINKPVVGDLQIQQQQQQQRSQHPMGGAQFNSNYPDMMQRTQWQNSVQSTAPLIGVNDSNINMSGTGGGGSVDENISSGPNLSYNAKTSERMRQDEGMCFF